MTMVDPYISADDIDLSPETAAIYRADRMEDDLKEARTINAELLTALVTAVTIITGPPVTGKTGMEIQAMKVSAWWPEARAATAKARASEPALASFDPIPGRIAAAYQVIERLIEWEGFMGGWDAPVWDEARAFLDPAQPQPPAQPDELGD